MNGRQDINLLPLQFRQRVAIRRILIGWAWGAAAVASCCLLQISATYNRHRQHAEQIEVLQAQSEPVLALINERQQLQQRHGELLGMQARVASLIPSDDLLQTLGAVATATVPSSTDASTADSAAPAAGTARIQALRIDLSGAKAARREATAESFRTHVAFTAVARDEPSLSELIARLRTNPRFHNVRLRGTAEHDSSGGRRAEVEAEVVVEKELPE